jgi:hypothetical protein
MDDNDNFEEKLIEIEKKFKRIEKLNKKLTNDLKILDRKFYISKKEREEIEKEIKKRFKRQRNKIINAINKESMGL